MAEPPPTSTSRSISQSSPTQSSTSRTPTSTIPTSTSTTPTSTSTSTTPTSTSTTPITSSTPVTSSTSSVSTPSTTSTTSSASLSSSTSLVTVTLPSTSASQPRISTSTQIIPVSTASPSRSVAASSANTGFFANKGAVAGVFTVVGLIGLAIIIALLTTFLRRRRAKKYDKDTAEAAMEAAASSRSHHFDDYGSGYGGDNSAGAYGGFSAESHGTYAQPAMSHGHGGENYVMNDIGGGYDGGYGAAAGAAGIGAAAGAAAMQRARSRKETGGNAGFGVGPDYGYDDPTPYPAFAGPGVHQPPTQEMYDQPNVPGLRYRRTPGGQEPDLLEAAGLGVSAGAGAAGAGAFMNRRPSDRDQPAALTRHKSQGSFGPVGEGLGYSNPSPPNDPSPGESYAAHYQPGYTAAEGAPAFSEGHGQVKSDDPFRRNTMTQPQSSPGLPNPHEYDAYPEDSMQQGDSDEDERHFQGRGGRSEEGRLSVQDDDDYGRQPRVLKVANA